MTVDCPKFDSLKPYVHLLYVVGTSLQLVLNMLYFFATCFKCVVLFSETQGRDAQVCDSYHWRQNYSYNTKYVELFSCITQYLCDTHGG